MFSVHVSILNQMYKMFKEYLIKVSTKGDYSYLK